MASVLQVYEALRDLTNKEQRGFITPTVFNSFAQIAQTNVFNSILNDQVKAKQIGKQGADVKGVNSIKQRKQEDLNSFLFVEKIPDEFDGSVGKFKRPKSSAKIVSIWDSTDALDNVNMLDSDLEDSYYELFYDHSSLRDVLKSNLSAPTENYKIALISDYIYVYGDTPAEIWVSYYTPVASESIIEGTRTSGISPSISMNIVNGFEILNPATSRNFILPEHYTSDLIYEIARMVGIRIREKDLIAYTTQKLFEES